MKIEWKSCFRIGISVLVVYLAILYWSRLEHWIQVLIAAAVPLILGCVIAYLVDILVSFYESYYFPKHTNDRIAKSRRPVCVLAAMVTLFVILQFVLKLVLPEIYVSIQSIVNGLPGAIEQLITAASDETWIPDGVKEWLESIDWKDALDKIIQVFTNGVLNAVNAVTSVLSEFISTSVTFLLGFIFSLYLLLGKATLKRQLFRVFHTYLPDAVEEKLFYVLHIVNECFHRYVVGQCIEAVILGGLCAAGMMLFKFPYAVLVGVLIGVTALIPVAGAYIGAGVGMFLIVTVSPIKALLFLVYIVILQQLEGNLIYPRVVGNSIGLPGIWVLAAVTVGGSLMGILGMLVGVPLAAACYRLLGNDLRVREAAAFPQQKEEDRG